LFVLANTMLVNLQSEIKFPSSSVIFISTDEAFFLVNNRAVLTTPSNTSNDLPIFQFHVLLFFALIKNWEAALPTLSANATEVCRAVSP
jgi:hypothetical protein